MKRAFTAGVLLIGISTCAWVVLRWVEYAQRVNRQVILDQQAEIERKQRLALQQLQSQQEDGARQRLQVIRRSCHNLAGKNAEDNLRDKMVNLGLAYEQGTYLPKDYEMYYQQCLRQAGIE